MVSENPLFREYKIAFLIDSLGMGGAERMMVSILKYLQGEVFVPRVAVFKTRDGNPIANEIASLGVAVDFLSIPYLRDLSALPRLLQYLKRTGADLIHTQLEFANALGNLAAKLRHLPSVCTIHTMPSQEMSVKSWAHQMFELWSLNNFCDRIIAVSEEARLFHLKISGAPEDQTLTIYNGVEINRFKGQDDERFPLRRELGIPPEADVLVTVAVLRELKGIQFMIRALPQILAARPKTYYLVAGDGDYHTTLEAEAQRAGVTERVIFTGMRTDVPRVLAAGDVFVLPTLTEALPTVLAEAMASRLPVIASAVGGIPEMVIDGENGLLLQPGDPQALAAACINLLSKPAQCEKMGNRGWQIVNEKFNVERQVERLKKIYLDLLKKYER